MMASVGNFLEVMEVTFQKNNKIFLKLFILYKSDKSTVRRSSNSAFFSVPNSSIYFFFNKIKFVK